MCQKKTSFDFMTKELYRFQIKKIHQSAVLHQIKIINTGTKIYSVCCIRYSSKCAICMSEIRNQFTF